MLTKKTKENNIVEYNIEYAHIYADECFGNEHKKSVEQLKKTIQQLNINSTNYTLVILIDEYNSKKQTLNIKQFLKSLKDMGAEPDILGFESKLAPYKKQLLNALDLKTKKKYKHYIKKHRKIPCSFLAAIWHLKRLGAIKTKNKELKRITSIQKSFVAKKIITILPQRYQEVEIRAQEIIKASKFKPYAEKMISVFFD